MKDSKGRICEYDGYKIPDRGEDTAENRKLRAKAMRDFKEMTKEIKAKRGIHNAS